MANLDLKKEFKHLYNPSSTTISEVHVPPLPYLMIDGQGDPNTDPVYKESVTALYAIAYGIRAISKSAGTVFTVMPLEGLWWWHDMPDDVPLKLSSEDKSSFLWTLMILQPSHVTAEMAETARENAHQKKNLSLLDAVRFEAYTEGHAAQIMHIGPYDDEGPTIQRLHNYITDKGYQLSGKHHEIYLNDPRKVAPEKLKTIIRQPFTSSD